MHCAALPDSFAALMGAASGEGFTFLEPLASRWTGEAYDRDEDASVMAVFGDGALTAIGAQTYDDDDPSPDHRRIRHFYVAPASRCAGALIQEALHHAPFVHLRARHAVSFAFWEAMGFARTLGRADRTHRLARA